MIQRFRTTLLPKEADIAIRLYRQKDGAINRLTIYSDYTSTARRVDETHFHPKSLQHYTGAYYSPELNTTYDFIVEDGKLLARHHRHPDFQLHPIERDRLSADAWFFSQVKVVRDDRGQITGLRVSNGRVRDLWFEKQ